MRCPFRAINSQKDISLSETGVGIIICMKKGIRVILKY